MGTNYTHLLRVASEIDRLETRFAATFTEKEWEAYQKAHPNAKREDHTITKSESKAEPSDSGIKKKLDGFLSKVKNLAGGMKESLDKANDHVKSFVSDPSARKEGVATLAKEVKKAPKKIAARVYASAKDELHELHHAGKAIKKVFEKPPQKWDKKDYKALYAASVYAGGAVIAAAGGGPLIAAGAIGKSFATHVGIKALHKVLDSGFVHFEAGEMAMHVLHHLAGEEGGEAEDPHEKALMSQLTAAVGEVLAEGLSEEDMHSILQGTEDPDFDDLPQPKAAKTEK